MRNPAVAQNWPDVGLRNCRFAWNWPVLLGSQNLWKTPCTTFLLLEIGPKSHCATVVFLGRQSLRKTPCALFLLLEIGVKTLCATVVLLQIGPYCYEAKACEKRRAQLSCCSKLAPSQTAQKSFCSKFGRIVRKLRPVRKCVRNCPVNRNSCLLWKSYDLSETPCPIVLLLEIGLKSHCATFVLLEIGPYC